MSITGLTPSLARRAVGIATFTRFADGMGVAVFMAVAPLLAMQFGATVQAAPMIAAVASLFWLLSSPVFGWLSDRHGRRGPIVLGVLFSLAGAALPILVPTLLGLLVSRMLIGVGSANSVPCSAVYADMSTPERRPQMMALRQASFSFGLMAGPLVALLATGAGLTAVFWVLTALFGVNLLLTAFMPETRLGGAAAASSPAAAGASSPSRPVGATILLCVLVTLSFALVHSALPLVLAQMFVADDSLSRGLPLGADSQARTVALTTVSMMTATFSAFAAQMFLAARLIRRVGPVAVVIGITLLWAATQAVTPLTQSVGWYAYLLTVISSGACYGLFYPALSTVLSLRAGMAHQARAFGKMEMASASGILVAPLMSGWLAAAGPQWLYGAAASVMIAAALLAMLLRASLAPQAPEPSPVLAP